MLRAVLDTNVVVSAHLKPGGREAQIFLLALAGMFQMCVSEPLMEEYEGVLQRARLGLAPKKIGDSLRAIRRSADLVHPQESLHVTQDPEDNKVLECAVSAGADYVVTGNLRDFPAHFQGIKVVSPREFQSILAGEG